MYDYRENVLGTQSAAKVIKQVVLVARCVVLTSAMEAGDFLPSATISAQASIRHDLPRTGITSCQVNTETIISVNNEHILNKCGVLFNRINSMSYANVGLMFMCISIEMAVCCTHPFKFFLSSKMYDCN